MLLNALGGKRVPPKGRRLLEIFLNEMNEMERVWLGSSGKPTGFFLCFVDVLMDPRSFEDFG